MKNNVSNKTKDIIRSLFKELIKVYKSKKYKDEIIHVESNQNDIPVFQLRFFKRGEKTIYYRILLNQKETSNNYFSSDSGRNSNDIEFTQ